MHKLTTRILSLFMVFTMMLSLSPPVIAQDGADPAQQTETGTAGTQLPEEGSGQSEAGTAPSESAPADETPVSPEPEQQEKSEEAASVPASPQVPEQLPAETPAAETPAEPVNPDPAPVEVALPRLTALYEGHRIHYIDSPKHPLPAEAGLFMAEIPEAEIPLYLRRAAQALGLESCGMYLYFIAAPVAENASTSEILQFSGDENDPEDRMTVEVTLYDVEGMSDDEKTSRLQELRNAHIDDLQVILLGARWEDDVVVPHSYDEETGVIRFAVSTVDKFILIVPEWETAVYPHEETPTEPETAETETVEPGGSETENQDTGTESPSEQTKDTGTELESDESLTETPAEITAPENPPAELPESSDADTAADSVNTGNTDDAADDTEKAEEPAESGDTTAEQTEQVSYPAAAEDAPEEKTEQTDDPAAAEDTTAEQTEQTGDPADADDSSEEQPEQTEETAAVSEGTVTAEGSDYSVSLTYTTDANIPEGSVFELSEVPEGGILYDNLTNSVANTLNADSEEIVSVTFVDVDVKKDGDSVALDANVSVSIEVNDSGDSDVMTQVVALGEQNEVLDAQDANAASFSTVTDSLSSTYAIVKITKQATLKTSDDQTWQITVTYDRDDPGIPADAELAVTELLKGTPEYEEYVAASAAATGADPESLSFAKAFDISLLDPATGAECRPAGEVAVSIQLLEEKVEENDQIEVVHFGAEEAPKQIDCAANSDDNAIEFATPGFSVFVIMKVIKEQILTASDGNSYKITVSYDRESGIPEDARLVVSEIREGDEGYAAYVAQSAEKLGTDPEKVNFARAFDISLKNPETGEEYQPDKSVKLSVNLLDENVTEDSRIDVVHFPGEADGETEIMETNINGEAVEFSTDGFSVYVIIDHEGGEIKEPRVEFHFIDHYTDEQYTNGIDVSQTTQSTPYNFVNSAGKYQTTQILKNGETLELIAEPENIHVESSEKYFYGWYVVSIPDGGDTSVLNRNTGRYTGTISLDWPAQPQQIKFEYAIQLTPNAGDDGKLMAGDTLNWTLGEASGSGTLDSAGTVHVYLAPLYEDFYFVNFHKGPKDDTSGLASSLMTRKLVVFGSADSVEVRIGNVKCESPDPAHQIFVGWEHDTDRDGNYEIYRTVDFDGNEVNGEGEPGEYYVTITKTNSSVASLELYPVFAEARWLYFNTGKSGNSSTYVAAAYRLTNDDRPNGQDDSSYYFDNAFFTGHASTRPGYTLGGWYLFANIDGETGEISNLSEPESFEIEYLDEKGEKKTTTLNTTAIPIVDASGNILTSAGTWYVDRSGTISATASTGSSKLFEVGSDGVLRFYKALNDLTLYAKWEEITASTYQVIVWKESMTDTYAKNALPESRHFDFVQTYTFKGTSSTPADAVSRSGSAVTDAKGTYRNAVLNGTLSDGSTINQELSYTGFYFGKYDDSVTISPDGTSVVNVYYYRNVVTYQFYTYGTGQTGYTITTSNDENPQQYGRINGEYVELRRENALKWQWTATKTYARTTQNDGSTQYAIVDGEYVQLTAVPHTIEQVVSITASGYRYNSNETNHNSTFSDSVLYIKNGNDYVIATSYNSTPSDYYISTSYGFRRVYRISTYSENKESTTAYTYRLQGETEDYDDWRFMETGTSEYTGVVYTREGTSAPYTYTAISAGDNDNDPTKYGVDDYGGHFELNGDNVTVYTWATDYAEVYTASSAYEETMYGDIGGEKVELTPVYESTTTTTDVYKLTSTLKNGNNYLIVSSNSAGSAYALGHSNTNVARDSVNVISGSPNYILASDVDETSVWQLSATNRFGNGVYYIRNNNGTLQISNTATEWTQRTGDITGLYDGNYDLIYDNNTFSLSRYYYSNVYFYVKDSIESSISNITSYTYNGEPYTGTRYTKSYGHTDTYVAYTGTRWVKTSMRNNQWNLYRDEIGLYGEKLAWPSDTSLWWYETQGTTSGSGTRMTYKDAFLPMDNDMTVEYWAGTGTGNVEIRFYTQNIDNPDAYTLAQTIKTNGGNFSINDKFAGFHASQYRTSVTGAWTNVGTYNESTGVYGSAVSYSSVLEIRYIRNTNDLIFFANYPIGKNLEFNGVSEYDSSVVKSPVELRVTSLLYGASLSGYENYYNIAANNPTNATLIAPDHYIFGGWYKDDSCTVKFDFSDTMPDGNATAYAKWTPERFRINIDPNGAEIDHIDHTNASYAPYVQDYIPGGAFKRGVIYKPGSTTEVERPADSGYRRDQSTYVNETYGKTVGEYSLTRKYIPISDAAAEVYDGTIYYYINTQYSTTDGSGLPSDCRNALYVTSDGTQSATDELYRYWQFYHDWTQANLTGGYISGTTVLDYDTWRQIYVSPQKYRAPNVSEHWTFLGWFKDDDTVPYNFGDPITSEFTLTAKWRLDGGYKIEYVPEYILPDGAVVNGDMPAWKDPDNDGVTYADGASTQIYKAPTDLKLNGEPITDDSVIFRGWALVAKGGTDENPTYTPMEKDSSGKITTYYEPSDPYTINAANAAADSHIYLQAIYQYKESSDRRPTKADLILDANTGYINATDLPSWDYPGNYAVNTEDHLDAERHPTQIEFGDSQASAAVHLYKYATVLEKDAAGNELDPKGKNYFTHPDGYFLLGFDDGPTEGDYIASYPADSVIAVTRNDSQTIYAIWEPMVYVAFENKTGVGPVTFGLSSSNTDNTENPLEVINVKDGMYDRHPLSDFSSITVPDGESITLAFPKGAEKNLTISGTNNLGIGKKLIWNSSIELQEDGERYATGTQTTVSYDHTFQGTAHSHTLVSGEVNNSKPFSFSETMIVNKEPLTVTFTSKNNNYVLLLDDNYEGGGMHEYDYALEDIQPDDNGVKSQRLTTTSTRIGYSFIGWAYEADAVTPDFSASLPQGSPWTIPDLNKDTGFFSTGIVEMDGIPTRTLYGVWEAKTDAIYIYNDIPEPGNQEQAFVFTLSITGQFKYGNPAQTDDIKNAEHDFRLKHGEYLRIASTNENPDSGAKVTAYVQSAVQVFSPVISTDGTTSYVEDTSRSYTVRWEKAGITGYASNRFEELKLSVTEASVPYYDTSVTLSAESGNKVLTIGTETYDGNVLPKTVSTATVSWGNTDAGGTMIFVNRRQTYNVRVTKQLVSNKSTQISFNYKASYEDEYQNTHNETITVEKDLQDFMVTSGGERILEGVPAGVKLTVTETTDEDKNYAIETTGAYTSGANDVSTILDADNNSKNEAFAIDKLSGNARISFNNTLKSYKVTIQLVDQDMSPTINGLFSLSSSIGSLGSDLYASSDGHDGFGPGIFYTSDKFWADTYTLNQKTVPTGYFGPTGEVTLKVTGNGIFSDNEFVIPEQVRDQYNEPIEGEYIIYVINWKTVNMTLRSGLLDPMVSQRTFTYSGTYELEIPKDSGTKYQYDLNRNLLLPGAEADTVQLVAYSTSDGSVPAQHEPYLFAVPIRAKNLTISEDITQVTDAPETVESTYDIYVRKHNSNDHDPSLDREIYNKETGYVYKSEIIDDNRGDIITFFNERKTVDITVRKIVEAENKDGTFSFTAVLSYRNAVIKGYPIFINGTRGDTADDEYTNAETGEYQFSLIDFNTQTQTPAVNKTHVLTIPVGTKLTIREAGVTGRQDGADLGAFETTVNTTVTSGGAVFTGTTVFDEAGKLFTLPTAPKDGLTVTFTNTQNAGSRRVILRKVLTGKYEPLDGRTFVIHKGNTDGTQVEGTDIYGRPATTFTSGDSGVFYCGELNYGTYYLHETNNGKWFFLIVDKAGVFDSQTVQYGSEAEVKAAAEAKISEIKGQT